MVAPASRGVPARESLWLPPVDSPAIKAKSLDEEVRWSLTDVVEHVFPRAYQPQYHKIALALLGQLSQKTALEAPDLAAFVGGNGFSKATFYNKIIPRLIDVGAVKRERIGQRAMRLTLSKSFGNYLQKIGREWNSIVETARRRQPEPAQPTAPAP